MSDIIYHYTSINTLALILSQAQMKFNCLSNVDDMLEGITTDLGSLSKYIFVSCWTKDSEENIALWNMYTPQMTGVRVGLPPEFLKPETNDDGLVTNVSSNARNYNVIANETFRVDVEYVDEEELGIQLIEMKKSTPHKTINLYLPELGKKKSKLWAFQNETRYILFSSPKKHVFQNTNSAYANTVISILQKAPTNLNQILLKVELKSLSEMDLLLGPSTTSGDKCIVEALVDRYIPDFKGRIRKSRVKIRPR